MKNCAAASWILSWRRARHCWKTVRGVPVEQTMEIMARSFHLREFHVYVLTNGIFASAGTAEISEVRNVPTRTTHLSRVAAVNALSREIAEAI